MKAKIAFIALAMAVSAPAWAAEDPVGDLSKVTGLTERKVQMILGNRTAFAEYPYTYDRSLQKFVTAIGKENYQRLMEGEAVALRDTQGNEYIVQLDRKQLSNRNAL
ncbi:MULTISPECIES: hypothetical protein [unclassified Lysobacter]|uniref:hypothetical protein n=1 Tax=unclassified Lysobacter TaxID=2635362 RepID=UPI001C2460DE|nr:hypothetical protein [Lysobacter sp. MMG2]MBU8976683.1 hypothetical protein [Lysobacter sp. MMG2]